MKKWLYFNILSVIIISCQIKEKKINLDKTLDLGEFTISVPKNWNTNIPKEQEDSFIGYINGPKVALNFDCSNMGYANNLLETEKEYLKTGDWKHEGFFLKPGVTYTANFNVHNEKIRQMKKRGITDSSLIKVEADPSYETIEKLHIPTIQQKSKFPKADYIADLTYRDSTIYVPIEIPADIKGHYIQVDSTDKYVTKTIWPKVSGKGITGVYIHSRSSSFNFQMNGRDLTPKDQSLALQAFKTITFKK